MNRYPLWKNILVIGVLLIGAIVAAPNLFGDDPALQITREDGTPLAATVLDTITSTLDTGGIGYNAADFDDGAALAVLASSVAGAAVSASTGGVPVAAASVLC